MISRMLSMLTAAAADSNQVTTIDIISLTVAGLAFVTALAGFGWTIYEWNRSGARLKVTCTSFITFGPLNQDWMVAIEVTNSGRTATTVGAVGFEHPGHKGVILPTDPAVGPNPLPKRLDTGESFNFPVRPEDIIRNCTERNLDPLALTPYANSGHGHFGGKFLKSALDIVRKRMPEAED